MSAAGQLVMVGLLVCAAAAWDFATRVYVPREGNAGRAFNTRTLESYPPARTAADVARDLRDWLPSLGPVEGIEPASGTAIPKLSLVGIFHGRGQSFALLNPASADQTPTKLLRVAVGDNVQGLRVTELGRQSIKLEGDGAVQELMLFEPLLEADEKKNRIVSPEPVSSQAQGAGVTADDAQSPPWLPPGAEAQTPQVLRPGEEVVLPSGLHVSPEGRAAEARPSTTVQTVESPKR
jgi:hypothetical protein